MRSRTKCYGPTSHRKVEREVKGGRGFRARVGNMSSGTYMLEGEAKSVRGPKLTDQIVFKGRVRKLGCVLDSLWVVLFF